ncbi:agamous-like MADS-box protein AGL61 [Zingiber officinale]|uniref:agamous-like MADS-box protein AGL61 n=1 Tax=Zingiber officinale TaxID=94328 RepID=UPI001C4C3BF2|nr:agamous-like MADS-box protein AGL61 [Zingiber officinale]
MSGARKKTSNGKRKIEIKRIEKEEARQVCFCKRRASLFKKANELSLLCGAQLAVVVFSPSGKPFSYGHPSVDSILDRFSCRPSPPPSCLLPPHPFVHPVIHALCRQESELREQLEAERRRKEELEEVLRRPWGPVADLLNEDLEELGLPELDKLRTALVQIRAEAVSRAEQLGMETLQATSTSVVPRISSNAGALVAAAPAAGSAGAPTDFAYMPPYVYRLV